MNARDIGEYIGEMVPTNGKPAVPCRQCADRVFYQLRDAVWLCRTCHPTSYTWRTVDCWHDPQCAPPEHVRSTVDRWFVVPGGRS